jgi:hypothetical protein
MASDMRSLVNNQKYSDVVFKVDGKAIYAWKGILCARSEFFKAMFFSNLRESIQPEIPITDVNYASFLAIIEYIYTDTIQFDVLTVDNALQLVGAAYVPSMPYSCCRKPTSTNILAVIATYWKGSRDL